MSVVYGMIMSCVRLVGVCVMSWCSVCMFWLMWCVMWLLFVCVN